MSFENRRKEIMSKSRAWGEPVEKLPYTLQGPYPSPSIQKTNTPALPNGPLEDTMLSDRHDRAREDRHLPDKLEDAPDASCSLLEPTLTMTSTRGWSLNHLLDTGPNFHDVHRVSATSPDLGDTIRNVFEVKGRPLVIEGFHRHPRWPKEMFTLDHFRHNVEESDINVRNVHNWADTKIPLPEFITKCRTSGPYREDNEEVRFYGKDLECPKTWENWLQTGGVVPPSLISKGPEDLFRYRPKAAPVETLMCYLGIGDTFTPCHKDLCASSGQNLMCYTEGGGSSFWFITESSTAPVAARYFQELGQELDHENYIITLEELMKAPFKVFVIEQKIGDMVLVPPRSCHQVVNFGGITIKSSWSRMTLKGLSTAYHHELPIYRRVCRPEIYRVKSTIHHTLVGRTKELQNSLPINATDKNIADLVKDIKELLTLYDSILVEEYEPSHKDMVSRPTSRPPSIEEDICISCDFCGCDIFQSFFECGPSSDGCIVCPGCYVEGRNCKCKNARMQPMQYRDFQQLVAVRTNAVNAVARYEEQRNSSFELKLDLKQLGGKTAAVFRAACILYRNLTTSKPMKVCRQVKVLQTSHFVDFHSALTCKQCHNTKCFTHILVDFKVHSVEALLFHDINATHEKYHSNHQRRSRGNSDPLNQLNLQRHQKQGTTPPDRFLQLFDAASTYGDCRPIKVDAMNLGWYDNHPQSAATILDDSDEASFSSPSSAIVGNSSVQLQVAGVTTRDPQRILEEILKEVERVPADSEKKKPRVYVQVPKAAYSTALSRRTATVEIKRLEAEEPTRAISRLDQRKPSGATDTAIIATARRTLVEPCTIQHPVLAKPRICPQAPERCQKDNDAMKMNLLSLSRSLPPKERPGPTATAPSPAKSAISSLHFKKKPRENIHNGPDGGSLAPSVSNDIIHDKESSDPSSSPKRLQANELPVEKLLMPLIPVESQHSQGYGRAEVHTPNSIAGQIIASTILRGMGSMMMEGANPGCNNSAWSNMSPALQHQQSYNTHYNTQVYGPNRPSQYHGPKNTQNLKPNYKNSQGFAPPGQQNSHPQHNYATYSLNTHPTYPYYPQYNDSSHLATQRAHQNRHYSANKHHHNRPAQPPHSDFDQHHYAGRPQEGTSYFDSGHNPKKRKYVPQPWDRRGHLMGAKHNNEWNTVRPRPSDFGESYAPKKAKYEHLPWHQEGRVTQVPPTRPRASLPRPRRTNVNEAHSLNHPTPEGQQLWKQTKGSRKSRWDVGPEQSRQSSITCANQDIRQYDRPDHEQRTKDVVQTSLAPDPPASESPEGKLSNQGGIRNGLQYQPQPTLATEKAHPFTPPPMGADLVCETPPKDGNNDSTCASPRTSPDDFLMDDSDPSNWEYDYEQEEYESTPVAFRFQGVQAHHDGEVSLGDEFDLTTNPWNPSPK